MKFVCLSISFFVLLSYRNVAGRLEPTPLVHDRIFKLQNQHDGRYLTEGRDGTPTKGEYSGNLNQKFRFLKMEENGKVFWSLVPLSSLKPLYSTLWDISYVGHGKYQLKSSRTGLCLQATGTTEASCGKGNPLQRWFVEATPEGKST